MPPDSNGDGSMTMERLSPEEAFGLLGHEIRFGVLEALNDADGTLQFSTLRDRVGVQDSGQFNHHLGDLTGRFVHETDDGYQLAPAGKQVVGAVLSGAFTKEMETGSVDTEAPCLVCDEGMEAHFRKGGITLAPVRALLLL